MADQIFDQLPIFSVNRNPPYGVKDEDTYEDDDGSGCDCGQGVENMFSFRSDGRY
jgi:hypothetical protein